MGVDERRDHHGAGNVHKTGPRRRSDRGRAARRQDPAILQQHGPRAAAAAPAGAVCHPTGPNQHTSFAHGSTCSRLPPTVTERPPPPPVKEDTLRRAIITVTAGLLVAAAGCVQQDKYDDAILSSRSLKEQLVAAQQQRDTATANLQTVRTQLEESRAANDQLQSQIGELNTSLDVQLRKYDEMLRRISQLEFGPLPAELEEALDHLAAAYPDLLAFDPKAGMLRFSSDFTFDLGSAEVRPDASATITTLAEILNSPEAAAFEIRLIGHTDNLPVERPSTLRNHPTNVHLSVHRAIAVRDALVASQVAPGRVQVAGYGEFRPIVPNGPKGAAQNRRVELLLVPMRTAEAPPQPQSTEPAVETPEK